MARAAVELLSPASEAEARAWHLEDEGHRARKPECLVCALLATLEREREAPNLDTLAEKLHDAMCRTSHHERDRRCNEWPKYPSVARYVVNHWPRRRAATPAAADKGPTAVAPLDVDRLAAAINDAQVQAAELRLGHDLRVPAERIAAAYTGAAAGKSPRIQITHGRHCPCSACAREDWTNPNLAHCSTHGPSCPREYAPETVS